MDEADLCVCELMLKVLLYCMSRVKLSRQFK